MVGDTQANWLIIGAGPAGIATVGNLLDQGVEGKQITWVDPSFSVGDFASKWHACPSNTKVDLFLEFLKACRSFNFDQAPKNQLNELPKDKTCLLKLVAEQLQWTTQQLTQQVNAIQGTCTALNQTNSCWQATLNSGETILANKVVIALGATPIVPEQSDHELVLLEQALNPERLATAVNKDDIVAVYGSSHSGILAIKNLVAAGVKKIINIYRSPLRYAIYHDDWIEYDNTGLKGTTAEWAKSVLEASPPTNLKRIKHNGPDFSESLKHISKAIYAIGFQRNNIHVNGELITEFNPHTGQIAENLYGVGIAFPEKVTDKAGNIENNVGLWKFMNYLRRVSPTW